MPITAVRAEPISGTIQRDIAIISSLGEHTVGQYVLVRVSDDAGRVGLGEASVTSRLERRNAEGRHRPDRRGTGPAADRRRSVRRGMDRPASGAGGVRQQFRPGGPGDGAARPARPDLGVPVYRLLGGKDAEAGEPRHPAEVRGRRRSSRSWRRQRRWAWCERGWRSIKVKVGRHESAHRRGTVAGGPRAPSGRTSCCRWTPTAVTRSSRRSWAGGAAREGWRWPCSSSRPRRGDHAAMAEVRRRSGVPIMADESVFTPQDALEVIRRDAADVLSLYPGKHGGIRATQQIAKLAEAAGIPCTIGSNLEREVATAAMAHVAVATAELAVRALPRRPDRAGVFRAAVVATAAALPADRLWVPEEPPAWAFAWREPLPNPRCSPTEPRLPRAGSSSPCRTANGSAAPATGPAR